MCFGLYLFIFDDDRYYFNGWFFDVSFMMPSSFDPNHSLTLWDATSSEHTLNVALMVAAVFVPIILGYTLWIYFKMFGRIDADYIEKNKHSLY